MRSGPEIQIPCMCADYGDRAGCPGPQLSGGRPVFLEWKRHGGDGCEIPCCGGLIERDGVLAGTRVISGLLQRCSLPAR